MSQQEWQNAKDKAQSFLDAVNAGLGEFIRGREPTPEEEAAVKARWAELQDATDAILE